MSLRAMACGLVAILLTVALAVPAAAQTLYGSLTGNVTDASGAAVPNAKVDVLNVGTGILKTAQTDERGSYLFNDLQPGTYGDDLGDVVRHTRGRG
jgi:protocatechuate 3,4-dioxygenase beta subunit